MRRQRRAQGERTARRSFTSYVRTYPRWRQPVRAVEAISNGRTKSIANSLQTIWLLALLLVLLLIKLSTSQHLNISTTGYKQTRAIDNSGIPTPSPSTLSSPV